MLPFYFINVNLWQHALTMLLRLKWFFLSILVVYLFLSPAEFDPFSINYLSVSLLPALFRISVLVLILLAVNIFIKTTSKEEILSSLVWLFFPLKRLNINVDRFALRAVLTLEYIDVLNYRMSQYKKEKLNNTDNNKDDNKILSNYSIFARYQQKKRMFFHLIRHSGIILREILLEADTSSGKIYHIDTMQSPLFLHLFIPAAIALLLFLTMII